MLGGISPSAWLSASAWKAARRKNSGFGKVLKGRMPRHRQIGAIDLQHKTRCRNGGVLFPHRLGDGLDIVLMTAVIFVRQKARDHAGRGRGQKCLGRPRGIDGGAHIGEVARQRLPIADGDRTNAGHALEPSRPRQLRHLAAQIGKRRQIGVRFRAFRAAFIGKAGQAIVHIGGVTDLAGLAVADDIDADIDLPLDDVQHGLPNATIELHGVESPAVLAFFEQMQHRVAPRQAADMRCQNSLLARFHRDRPPGLCIVAHPPLGDVQKRVDRNGKQEQQQGQRENIDDIMNFGGADQRKADTR